MYAQELDKRHAFFFGCKGEWAWYFVVPIGMRVIYGWCSSCDID